MSLIGLFSNLQDDLDIGIDVDMDLCDIDTIEGGIEIDMDVHDVINSTDENQLLYALDRMTNDIDEHTLDAATEYFNDMNFDQESFNGVLSNLKGIYGEIQVLEELEMRPDFDAHYVIPTATNHEGIDIYGIDDHGKILEKYQVKMSLDKSYIQRALNELPEDVKIICPSEIAGDFDSDRVIDLGVSLLDIEGDISDLIEVLNSVEPWENELDEGFENWLARDFKFDMGLV